MVMALLKSWGSTGLSNLPGIKFVTLENPKLEEASSRLIEFGGFWKSVFRRISYKGYFNFYSQKHWMTVLLQRFLLAEMSRFIR